MVDQTSQTSSSPTEKSIAHLQERVRHLTLSHDLTHEFIKSNEGMSGLMKVIFSKVLQALDAEAGSLWLYQANENKNICYQAEGPTAQRILGLRMAPEQGIVGQVIAHGKEVIVFDCSQDPRFSSQIDQTTGFRTQSMICVPLIDQNRVLGAIQVINKKTGKNKRFSESDQLLVQDLSLSAAIALDRARQMGKDKDLSREKARIRQLTFARDLTRKFIQSSKDMHEVMRTIFDSVLEALDAEAGSLWIKNAKEGKNICYQAGGPAKSKVLGLRLPFNKGIVGQVIEANSEEVVLDCTKDPRFDSHVDQSSGFRTQSMICVPLNNEKEAFGAIQVINKRSGLHKQFSQDDLRLMQDLALSASLAVRNAKRMDQDSIIKERRKIQQLTFSRDLTREFIQSSGNVSQVMHLIFSRVLGVLEAEAGSLWMSDPQTKQNVCHQAEGPAKSKVLGLRLPPGKGIVGQVIAHNKDEVVLDCSQDSRFDAQIDKASGFKTHSMICVALADQGAPIGAIQIINKKSGFQKQFVDEDYQLVKDLALSATIAVRSARLLETESRVKEMNALMEVSQQVISTLDLDQVMDTLVNSVDALVKVDSCIIALLNEESNTLFIAALPEGEDPDPSNKEQQQLLTLMEKVRQGRRVFQINDRESFGKQSGDAGKPFIDYLEHNELHSVWSYPLADEEGTLGVIWLESQTPNFAAGKKSDILYILTSQATVALRNASLFQRIPFANVLGKISAKSKRWSRGWRRNLIVLAVLSVLGAGLHYFPVFRYVSGACMVDARLGQGIYLKVDGRVREVLAYEGSTVKKGDVLARLDDEPIRLELIKAESKLAILERELVEAQVASQSTTISRTIIERIAARAELDKAKSDLEKVEIRASANGVVLTPRTQELIGREFKLGDEMFRVGDPKQFAIVVELPEEDLMDVHVGQQVKGVLRSQPGDGFRGEVRHIGRAYSIPVEALEKGASSPEPPKGFIAEVTIKESDVSLMPGMTGYALISTPQTSLVQRQWRRLRNTFAFWLGF